MDTRRTTVSQAFLERIQYVVPSYQRNYVWTQADQWEPLWDDVLEVVRRLLTDGRRTEPHFLGTIITKPFRTGQSRLDRWSVVDGQQRLTTLQLLIAAAHSAFSEHEEIRDFATILAGYLSNVKAAVVKPRDRYKIRHKSSDYGGFSSVVELGLGGAEEDHGSGSGRLRDCYAYFRNRISEWLDSADDLSESADALRRAIMDYLQVVDISLEKENGHAIFEALNARGAPLSEWEKTKNYILSLAVQDDDPDGDRTYTDYLEEYDSDPYWTQEIKATRFSGKRIDLFLFFFAQIEIPTQRRKVAGADRAQTLRRERLYRDFRLVGEQIYRKSGSELRGLLDRFCSYSKIYRRIDQGDDRFSDYARLVMRRREKLTLSSLVPAFMVLVKKLGYEEDLDQALRIVDSYLMRRVALKTTYSGFDEIAFGYVQAIRDAPSGLVCATLIDEFENASWTNRWPRDDEIVLHLREKDMYHRISSARKQLLLEGVAQRMHEECDRHRTMPFGSKASLTVEHVAPQNWQRHWKDELRFGDTDEDRQHLNRVVHRIGNLTLVTRALNPKLGDRPWSYKRELLEEDNLEMNQRLLQDMEGDTWNEEEINRRSDLIAAYVNEIWPHAATLRQELGIAVPEEQEEEGLSRELAQWLVDGATDSGVEDGWADRDGLNRTMRGERYGRYISLGGGSHWHGFWFGASSEHRHLELDYWGQDGLENHYIEIPDGLPLDDLLEIVMMEVRSVASAIATGVGS